MKRAHVEGLFVIGMAVGGMFVLVFTSLWTESLTNALSPNEADSTPPAASAHIEVGADRRTGINPVFF